MALDTLFRKYSQIKKIKEKGQPCSFEDFLSRNWPHLVHRVLEVGVAPLLLVRDGAKNVDLKFGELDFVLWTSEADRIPVQAS